MTHARSSRLARIARSRAVRVTVAVLVLAIVGGAWYVNLAVRRAPGWWNPADASRAEIIALGESTENRVVSEMNRVTGRSNGREWTIELTEEEINAWLAARLPRWAANQFPGSFLDGGVREAHVRIEPDRIRLGAMINHDGASNPSDAPKLSLALLPVMEDVEGSRRLVLDLEEMAIGRLPVPTALGLEMIRDRLDFDHDDLDELTALLEGQAAPVAIRSDSNRRLHLQSIDLAPGRLTLTWKTEYRNGG